MVNLKFELQDGKYHDVDSSDMAFMLTAQELMREQFGKMKPALLEPIMLVEIECPESFQGSVVGNISSRRGIMTSTETVGKMTQDHRRRAAGRDVRLLDRPALDDARAGHVHDGVRRSTAPCRCSIQTEIIAERKAELQPA